jgi:hypothetical protein
MIRMKQLAILVPLVLFAALFQTACQNDDNNMGDLSGIWRAAIAFSSCSPSDVCVAAGFQAGSSANAVMNLSQTGNNVNGTYTYEAAGITANVSGNFGGSQLLLDGGAANPFGQITVRLTGTVSNNTIQANVTHQISLIDGREGSVIGSGMFAKQ